MRCRTVKRKAEETSYDNGCFEFLNVSYDEYIMKGARTKLHTTAPAGMEQTEIPTRGRDFIPRRVYIRPADFARHGFTQGCKGCTWQQNRVGPRPGQSEACRARMESEIAKNEDDDRMMKVQERHDHFAAEKVAEGDQERGEDPRKPEDNEPKPRDEGGATDDATPSTPATGKRNPIFFEIDTPPGFRPDAEMENGEDVLADGPAGPSDRRVLTPGPHVPTIEEDIVLADGPEIGGERRIKPPVRRPAIKRRALTEQMFTHEDEPDTKKTILDEPEGDIDIGNLVIAHPGGGVLLPGKVGCQVEDRVIAVPEVGVLLTGAIGGSAPKPSDEEREAARLKSEDEFIIAKAILGHSLHEVYSNGRIELAMNRQHMERINSHLSRVDMSEIFSPKRVTAACQRVGLVPGEAMDIKSGYDFDKTADRKNAGTP